MLDLVSGMREIRAFGAGPRIIDQVNSANSRLLTRQAQLSRRMAFVGALSSVCTQTALLLLLAAIAGVGFDRIPAVQGVGLMFLTFACFEGYPVLPARACWPEIWGCGASGGGDCR